jgi:hypothetical protein
MIKTNFPMKHSQKLLFIALTLAVNASTAWAKDLLYRNDFSGPTMLNPINWVTSQIVNEQLILTSTRTKPTDPNNLLTSTGGVGPSTLFPNGPLPDHQTLELRVDVISAPPDDAFADIHCANSNGGYFFTKDQNEICLLKGWNNGNSWAVLFDTNSVVKNENITLVLALTRLGSNLKINARVLDKANGNAVLFDQTVIDTPQSDPVLPDRALKGLHTLADPAGPPYLLQTPTYPVVGLAWVNLQSAPPPLTQVTYDNFEVWQYESPELAIENAVVLSWPLTQDQFVLESALGLDGAWVPVPDPWWRNDHGQNEVTIRAPDVAKFYRLRQGP